MYDVGKKYFVNLPEFPLFTYAKFIGFCGSQNRFMEFHVDIGDHKTKRVLLTHNEAKEYVISNGY